MIRPVNSKFHFKVKKVVINNKEDNNRNKKEFPNKLILLSVVLKATENNSKS